MATSRTHEAPPPRTLLAATVVRGVHWTPVVWLLLVVCGAVFLDGLDTSMMGVAVTGSLLVLVYAVVEAPTRGWGSV
ncbi:hypothetical protein [Microtetraspora malaysiensis]|uniref:hypothetical protein n=1 Tax=Microtetraspora malaysiensis TaxID=161358 RepID=UPI0008309579|nr:hypothetical protein [Microtetraspora malaysiensis]